MTLLVNNVVKQFGEFTAVNHLSLDVDEGTMFGMLGANGAVRLQLSE